MLALTEEIADRAGRTKRRLTDPVRYMLKGAGVMLALGVVVALALGGWIVYVRSLHGQMAYEYIQQVIAQQQAQSPKASSPPVK